MTVTEIQSKKTSQLCKYKNISVSVKYVIIKLSDKLFIDIDA